MSPIHTYETIEAYHNGTLTGEALAAFEQQLQSDPDLAAQVQLLRHLDTALGDKPVLDFQKIVQAEEEAFLQKSQPKQAIVRRIGGVRRSWAIAAALLVVVISVVLFWQTQSVSPPSGEALFAQHFETYALKEGFRSDDAGNADFILGIQQYQAENYEAAAQTFTSLSENAEGDMALAFCLANAYLNQTPPQLGNAEQQFQKIIADGSSIYTPKAKWYMALILLKKEETEQAKDLLKDVAKSGDQFAEKAEVLLKEL